MPDDDQAPVTKGQRFTATSWSGLRAIQDGAPNAREALERLCQSYWYPLYAYIRRSGRTPQDAEDLTQGFFYQVLEKNLLGAADRKKGKFRSFLLGALKYYLQNEAEFRQAQKRGGGKILVSLDDHAAEDRYQKEAGASVSPDKVFEQRWALTLLANVKQQLEEEYKASGKSDLHELLKPFLEEETQLHGYDNLAERLNVKPNSVAVMVRRFRHRYGELVRSEILRTVADPEEAEDEMRHFYAALGR